ncbi:hypothetical protein J437_LFUL019305 [Ladona fulva]|uniref:PiggyBac transposable element-derived protein domain-containing protein n=1 Tax=Ladona fulva TaxID=123851 RepID=A0A8K0KTT0_LADFU|nr:hypothetical protein J437_LFUL019305 [Ladona fulva]
MEKKEETDHSSEDSDTTMEDDCSSVTSTTIEDIINQDHPEVAMDQLLQGLTLLRERIPGQKWKSSIQRKLVSGNFNPSPSATQSSSNAVSNVIPSTSGNNDNLNSANVNNDNVNKEGFKVVNHKRKYSAVNKNPSPEPIPLKNRFDPIQNSYTPAPIQPPTYQPTPVHVNPTVRKIKIPSIKVNYDQSWPNILNEWNIGICAIQETHLTTTQKTYAPNFQLICNDRLQRGGGVAFLKNRNVVLISTMHNSKEISNRVDKKPKMILEYNSTNTQLAVDTLDQLIATYTCRRKTNRWPVTVFYNVVDTAVYNAFVLWIEINPNWNKNLLHKRRIFLEELGKLLVTPYIEGRKGLPRNEPAMDIVNKNPAQGPSSSKQASNRARCKFCPSKCDNKTPVSCSNCGKYVCKVHVTYYCPDLDLPHELCNVYSAEPCHSFPDEISNPSSSQDDFYPIPSTSSDVPFSSELVPSVATPLSSPSMSTPSGSIQHISLKGKKTVGRRSLLQQFQLADFEFTPRKKKKKMFGALHKTRRNLLRAKKTSQNLRIPFRRIFSMEVSFYDFYA